MVVFLHNTDNKHSAVLFTTGYHVILSCATVYPKKYAHGFVVLCFVVVMQSFITNSHEVFIHIHQGCFAGTGTIVRLPQCQWSKPDGYGKISQCITTTKHSKAKTVCIFLGIYCIIELLVSVWTVWDIFLALTHRFVLTSFHQLFFIILSWWFTPTLLVRCTLKCIALFLPQI